MRKITYRQLQGVGPVDAVDAVTKSLGDFVEDIPYFLSFDLIPPITVMNEEFGTGEHDAGMSGGCVWKPFSITGSEYTELVEVLQERGKKYVEAPKWVVDRAAWHIWKFEYEIGVPSEEHQRLSREEDAWTRLREEAQKAGDGEKIAEYHVKVMEAGQRLADFLNPFILEYRSRRGR